MDERKILVTGATGHVARPIAEALARTSEVWCIGRFGQPGVEEELWSRGIATRRWDMGRDELDGLPADFTHVVHAAVNRGLDGDYDAAIEANTVAAGQLMMHCRGARAFLHVSTGAFYKRQALDHEHAETDPIDGVATWLPVYPVAKIAAEGAVRAFARTLGLPTVIARLNVSYGPSTYGGVPMLYFERMLAGEPIPVPREGQNWASPIHTDDIVRQVPLLWEVASVPATVVNWGGDERVGMTDLVRYLSEITGVEARLAPSDAPRETYAFDSARRRALIGDCRIGWREGIARTVEARHPGVLRRPIPAESGADR